MPEYRDYGAVGNATAPLVEVDTTRRTQVYQATHDGDQRLPFMYRSFISFSFDGKFIEDFNLLAIIENNALQRKLYAEFDLAEEDRKLIYIETGLAFEVKIFRKEENYCE